MSRGLRACGASLVAACTLCALAGSAVAQGTPAEKAEQLNEEGKKLFAEEKYQPASKKFEQAIILSPEGRFYFNLCFTLYFLERYADALEQCRAVEPNQADEKLIDKTNKLIAELEKRVPPAPPPPDPNSGGPTTGEPTTGGPTTGEPTTGPPPTGTPAATIDSGPPPTNPFVSVEQPFLPYKWSLGGEIGPLANLSVGDGDVYAEGGFALRLFANFVLSDERQFGIQPYFQFSAIEPGDFNPDDSPLRMFDFGAALFLHKKLFGRLYGTPLIGVHVTIQEPTSDPQDTFVAVGLRTEAQLAYVFGATGGHALTLTPGFNFYGPSSETQDSFFFPDEFGLDKGSATFALAIGYQMRFATPFGSKALISLE